MSGGDKKEQEPVTGRFEVHTYGKVAYVTVTDDVVKVSREASRAAQTKKREAGAK